MPEILATVTKSNLLPTGFSSEADTPRTDHSSSSSPRNGDDANQTSTTKTTKKIQQQQQQSNAVSNKKTRKSTGKRNQLKKPPLKINTQQKTAAAQNLKSQIPRSLHLTPSSSSTSLATTNSSSAATTSRSISTSSSSSAAAAIVLAKRQNSAAILNFRIQKSVSQMDFKHARRTGNFQVPLTQTRTDTEYENTSRALVQKNCTEMAGLVVTSSETSLVQKIFNHDEYYYVLQDRDPKLAGMRIFATIMLNAWRKRRDEVKRLMEEVNDLKRGSIKTKNQLHVFNTLFRVEQKRNDELNCQLKRSMEDISLTKTSCESLTTSLISIKADKALLEQQQFIKEQEFDGLNNILSQTKSELFKAMSQQRDLQATLSMEQRKLQSLENQKNELINEICELNNTSLQKEEKLKEAMSMKDAVLEETLAKVKVLEEAVATIKKKDFKIDELMQSESKLKQQIEALNSDVKTLHHCLAATLGNRLKSFWNNSLAYQRTTFHMLHLIAFYMLPATPQPKMTTIPFGLTLEKALSIVKR